MRLTLLSAALLATNIASAAVPVDGWYTSVFGGYTYLPGNIETANRFGVFFNRAEYDSGYNAGGRIGYKSNPLRYELEYTFLKADVKHFNVNFVRHHRVRGYSSANLGMANIYYDTPEMLPALVPFLGIGIGYAYVQESLQRNDYFRFPRFNANDSAFAYQGTVGLTYNFSENYAVNVAYRYVSTTRIDSFRSVFQAHLASAGAIYRFDYGTYK